jgi:hypothetical protein
MTMLHQQSEEAGQRVRKLCQLLIWQGITTQIYKELKKLNTK